MTAAGATEGDSSRITWAFVPPMPSELTAARRGLAARLPRPALCVHEEGGVGEVDGRVGVDEMEARRDQLVLQRQRTALISPATPAAASRWPMLVFTEPMAQNCFGCAGAAEGPGQGGDFDRIAHRRGGAVGLDVADGFRLDLGHGDGVGGGGRLAVGAGGPVAEFGGAVVVDRRAADDGVDVVAVADRVRQGLQQDQARPAAEKRSLGVGVEGAAMPVGGEQGLARNGGSPCGAARGR